MKLFTIPNIITLGNLLCGCLAIVCAFNGNLVWAAYLVGIAAVLDFLDGFVARALKQHSPIGKDLDSLADMVTFGVVPGVVMYQLMLCSVNANDWFYRIGQEVGDSNNWTNIKLPQTWWMYYTPYVAFLVTVFSALRLAKFNNDTRQSDSFIGVPTPANAILICSFALIGNEKYGLFLDGDSIANGGHYITWAHWGLLSPPDWMAYSTWILMGIVVIMSYLLISEIPLFALKFKSFKWKGNEIRYSFLAACLVMLVLLKFIALPLIIVLYILMSIVNNLVKTKQT